MPSRPASSLHHWLLFLALAAIWGSSFLFIKIGLEAGLQPFTLVMYRLLIATLFLAVIARVIKARFPRDRRSWMKLGVLAMLNVAIPFPFVTWGEVFISSALASILNGLAPLFTIVIAAVVLHDEPIRVNRLAGLLIGFAGAVVLLSPGLGAASGDASDDIIGELSLVAACIAYAAGGVFVRAAIQGRPLVDDPERGPRSLTPVEIALPQNAIALVVMTVLAVAIERPAGGVVGVPAVTEAWFAVIWLGLLGSGVAYVLLFRLVAAWGATRTSLVTYVMPIVGIALGILVLDERLDPASIAGAALVIAGLVLANSRFGQRRLYGRAAVPTSAATQE